MATFSSSTDNKAIQELRDETKKLRVETTKSGRTMFWLTFSIAFLTIVLVILTIILIFQGL